jgi:hypothetical protein
MQQIEQLELYLDQIAEKQKITTRTGRGCNSQRPPLGASRRTGVAVDAIRRRCSRSSQTV